MATAAKKKLTGRCMKCGKPYKTLVSWCPKCIKADMARYDKNGRVLDDLKDDKEIKTVCKLSEWKRVK